jgi:hypothetical protein
VKISKDKAEIKKRCTNSLNPGRKSGRNGKKKVNNF